MADSTEREKTVTSVNQRSEDIKHTEIIQKCVLIQDGDPALYHLKMSADCVDQSRPYRKLTIGARDNNKPHKTILMVGETGTGKTTLINTMINYMLGVERKDKVWFEITDDQHDKTQAHSQTSIITVYEFYLQESPIDLTIIDTPGYGDTSQTKRDKKMAENLLCLCKYEQEINEVDVICLVIMSHQNRLSDRQKYIFDAVQSLFGKDIAKNIVLLFTHSTGSPPKNALMAVREANVKCAMNDKNKPVFFLFNNCQLEPADEDEDDDEDGKYREQRLDQSWYHSFKVMKRLFQFLDNLKPKSLKMTQDVLKQLKQLEANVINLQLRVQMTELKQNELKQTREALEKHKEDIKENKDFEYEVEVPYKKKVDIDTDLASMATCCTICEENCHYPGCWWVSDLSWCSVMKDNHCTVCTNKCHYKEHVKQAKIYVIDVKIMKRTYEDVKKKYKDFKDKIHNSEFIIRKLEEDLQELEKEKIKLVNEAFDCVEKLQPIALNADSVFVLQHIDFLIEKLKEIKEPEKAEKLDNIKKRAGEEKGVALAYLNAGLTNINAGISSLFKKIKK